MADFEFNYTVGLNVDVSQVRTGYKALIDTLKPIDLKAQFPNLDTTQAQKAIDELGKKGAIKSLILETRQMRDEFNNIHEEVVKITGSLVGLQGHAVKFNQAIQNPISGLTKQEKIYDSMVKKANEWSTRAETMGEKDKTAIQGTSTALKEQIAQWKAVKGNYQQASPEARKIQENIGKLNKELDTNIAASKRSAVATQSWGDRIAAAIKQTVTYTFTIGMMRKAQQELNKAIRFAIELDTEMTKIMVLQAEGARTPKEINSLAQSFNNLGKEMGASTIEIAKGSVEWLRQGKTVEETGELLKSTIMLSKLGAIETADATEKLTSALNGYGLAAEDASLVVDKLVAVDNVAATSVRELTTAMQYSAAVANQTGVSLEQLISYIGTVSETTRQNAESIGQGMKTMLTRMQDIKAGAIDEDGLGINNVEIALKKAKIELRDGQDSFRDFGTVLEELAGKWDGLSETTQAYISKAVAGVRQVNMFTVLMQNMDRALELQEVQFTAAGLAADRYKIQMESLQAKIQVFRTTLEGLYQDAIEAGFIGSIIDLGTRILNLVEDFGGLEKLLKTLIPLFLVLRASSRGGLFSSLFKSVNKLGAVTEEVYTLNEGFVRTGKTLEQFRNVATGKYAKAADALTKSTKQVGWSFNALGASVKAFGKSMLQAAIPLVPYIAAIGALIAILVIVDASIISQKEAYDKLIKSQKEEAEVESKLSSSKELLNKYSRLKGIIEAESSSTEEIAEANKELIIVEKELVDMFPQLWQGFDSEKKAIGITTDKIYEQIAALEALEIAKDNQAKANAREFLFNEGTTYIGGDVSGMEVEKDYKLSDTTSLTNVYNKAQKDAEYYDDFLLELEKYKTAMAELGPSGAKEFVEGLTANVPEALKITLQGFAKGIQEEANNAYQEELSKEWIKTLQEEKKRKLIESGKYSETQAENAITFGTGEELKESLYYEILPDLIEKANLFKKALEDVSNGKVINEGTKDKLEALGITFDEVTGIFTDGNNDILDSADDFSKVIRDDLIKRFGELDEETLNWALSLANTNEITEETIDAFEKANNAIETANTGFNTARDVLNSYNQTGNMTIDQARQLIDAGYAEAVSINAATGQVTINEEALRLLIIKQIDAAIAANTYAYAQLDLADKVSVAGKSILNQIDILNAQKKALDGAVVSTEELAKKLNSFSPAGGAGGGGEDPAKKAIDDQIEALEDQKEAIKEASEERIELLEDEIEAIEEATENQVEALELVIEKYEEQIEKIEEAAEIEVKRLETVIDGHEKEIDALEEKKDAFNELIDKQKEALQEAKNADDYAEEQAKKAKDLGDLKTQIANMSLDTSDEGIAKRLELEEQAAELEGEILENSEDRKYDLQISALDKMAKAYEESIDAQIEAIEIEIQKIEDLITKTEEASEAQIKAIEKQIEVTEKQIDAIEKTSEAQVESIEKTIEAIKEETEDLIEAIDDQIKELRDQLGDLGSAGSASGRAIAGEYEEVKIAIQKAKDLLAEYGIDFSKMTDEAILDLAAQITKWENLYRNLKNVKSLIREIIDSYKEGLTLAEANDLAALIAKSRGQEAPDIAVHTGGLINAQGKVESHHAGNFAGNLKSNEVFAKLLKGEYVATEHQMDTFLKKILPQVAMHPDWDRLGSNSVGNITVNMPINVEGNMDSNVVPQIDAISKRVIDDINKALVARGFIRNTNLTVS